MSSSALDHDVLKPVLQSAKVNKTKPTKAQTRATYRIILWQTIFDVSHFENFTLF